MATLSIQGSVGKGGRNAYNDVRTVQKLLNQRRGSSPRISEDGVCGPATINAIIRFQRDVMKWTDSNLSFILFNDTKIPGVQYYVNHHHHMHAHFKT
jgi:lysozyme family protein